MHLCQAQMTLISFDELELKSIVPFLKLKCKPQPSPWAEPELVKKNSFGLVYLTDVMLVNVSRDMSKNPLADRGLTDEALMIKVFSCRRSLLSSVTSSIFMALVLISSIVSYPVSTELVTAKTFKALATSWKVQK